MHETTTHLVKSFSKEHKSQGQPTLYIPVSYGGYGKEQSPSQRLNSSVSDERRTVEIFERAGYIIKIVDHDEISNIDWSNPNSVGLAIDSMPFAIPGGGGLGKYSRLQKERAAEIGVPTVPSASTWIDILSDDEVYLAKDRGKSRGDGKFLLDNIRAKENFILMELRRQNLFDLGYFTQQPNRKISLEDAAILIEEARQALRNRDWGNRLFYSKNVCTDEYIDRWYDFERFITTPSEYYTSLKVAVDFKGRIHYSHLFHTTVTKDSSSLEPYIFSPAVLNNLRAVDNPWNSSLLNSYYDYLQHPKSPLYYPFKSVVSISDNSERIDLGTPCTDEVNREVLRLHGIDPDNPQLPSNVADWCRIIAVRSRDRAPYFTCDFILDAETGNWHFLEANDGVQLDYAYLGIPSDMTEEEAQHEMLELVLNL